MYRWHIFLNVVLIGVIGTTFAKNDNHNIKIETNHKTHDNIKNKSNVVRNKRALYDDSENPFWSARGKKPVQMSQYRGELDASEKNSKIARIDNEPPFWGMRGRRDSESTENYNPLAPSDRNSNEILDNYRLGPAPLWKTRRQEDDPFWGSRGRRQDDTPFWGQRGRREDIPFWGPRGRRRDEDDPFWSSRGRRDTDADNEPFWGNRGRRDDEYEPFWGNRGRRQEDGPFWGTRGRRGSFETFNGNQKQQLKKTLQDAIRTVEQNIENLARLQKETKLSSNSFWFNRGRLSQLQGIFQDGRYKYQGSSKLDPNRKPLHSTVKDDRILVEQPHYILVEHSGRSSGEENPYFVSRGKKKFINFELVKAARDRRGAIEEIVKSVRNDPYYIARGKKDQDGIRNGNLTLVREELGKAKELICATIDLIMIKKEGTMTKREINDNERDRRTILKKLAAQLQIDPYFVSRGKKSDEILTNEENLEEFITDVAEKCN